MPRLGERNLRSSSARNLIVMPQMRTHLDIVEDIVEACTAVDLRWDESSPVTLVICDSVERSCLDRVHARKTIGTETFLTNFTRQIHIVNKMF